MPETIKIKLLIDDRGANSKINKFSKNTTDKLNKIEKSSKSASKSMKGLFGLEILRYAEKFLRVMTDVTLAVVNMTKEYDRLHRSLKAVSAGYADFGEQVDFVRQASERLGHVYRSQIKGYAQLTATGRAAGIALEDIQNIYLSIAEASTVFQLSSDDSYQALRAIIQMISKGTISAEELRGQLGERVPGALYIMADALDIGISKLLDMMDKGELLAADVLPKFAASLRENVAGELSIATNSMQANINRLETSWNDFVKNVGNLYRMEINSVISNTKRMLSTISRLLKAWTDKHSVEGRKETVSKAIDATVAKIAELQAQMDAGKMFPLNIKGEMKRAIGDLERYYKLLQDIIREGYKASKGGAEHEFRRLESKKVVQHDYPRRPNTAELKFREDAKKLRKQFEIDMLRAGGNTADAEIKQLKETHRIKLQEDEVYAGEKIKAEKLLTAQIKAIRKAHENKSSYIYKPAVGNMDMWEYTSDEQTKKKSETSMVAYAEEQKRQANLTEMLR